MANDREFPGSYAISRDTFRTLAADKARWCKPYLLPHVDSASSASRTGAVGEELTVDVAYAGPTAPARLIIVSSGLHGVEGYFGAAVQHQLLRKLVSENESQPGLLLIHALNPFGFQHCRRFNEANVDLNRNFLTAGESYSGAPRHYAELDRLLNPAQAPRRADPFLWLAAGKIARYGLSALQQAIAGGQYEFPRGLFFGGHEPAATHVLLQTHFAEWLQGATEIVHLDYHTGLGPWATHKLLVDGPETVTSTQFLISVFGARVVSPPYDKSTAYRARGGLGPWCCQHLTGRKYIYACAEFGTYKPLKVLAGLRKENQAYWYSRPDSNERHSAAERLQELFCPASRAWRSRVLADGVRLVDKARAALRNGAMLDTGY